MIKLTRFLSSLGEFILIDDELIYTNLDKIRFNLIRVEFEFEFISKLFKVWLTIIIE